MIVESERLSESTRKLDITMPIVYHLAMNKKRHENQYSQTDFRPLYIMIGIMAVGAILWLYGEVKIVKAIEPISPAGMPIQAPVMPVATPKPPIAYNAPPYIVAQIKSLFGEDTQNILTIVGTCENETWDQTRTNTNRNGTKDWGIGQVNDANSKLCSGLDFKNSWKENIDCMHRIYKSQGLSAWSCSHTVGIDPFYMRSK